MPRGAAPNHRPDRPLALSDMISISAARSTTAGRSGRWTAATWWRPGRSLGASEARRTGRPPDPAQRARCRSFWAATTQSRSRCCAPMPTRADHAGADRPAHRLARRGERRARGPVQPDPPRLGDGARRRIFQIGLRGTGSARDEEVAAARAYGAELVTAYELHDRGIEAIVARIPDGGRYYLTVDMDGMDPSIAPAVAAPCPAAYLPPGAAPDPRTGAQGPRGRDGRGGDHTAPRT